MGDKHFPSATTKWHDNVYPAIDSTRPELSVNGKTIVITGGGSGIGAATARGFAAAGAARIAILGRRPQPLLDTKAAIEREFSHVEIFAIPADVSVKSQVDAAFAQALGSAGKIDILVSNAAVMGPYEGINEPSFDREFFLNSVRSNLGGALHVTQAFLEHAAPDAAVIEVNTAAAHIDVGPKFVAYGVAKMAIHRLWQAVGFAHPSIRVFHVMPGVVDTALNREGGVIAALGFEDDVSLPASFIVWVVSPEARFLNGKFLWANWDVDELKARATRLQSTQQLNIQLVGWPFSKKTISR